MVCYETNHVLLLRNKITRTPKPQGTRTKYITERAEKTFEKGTRGGKNARDIKNAPSAPQTGAQRLKQYTWV